MAGPTELAGIGVSAPQPRVEREDPWEALVRRLQDLAAGWSNEGHGHLTVRIAVHAGSPKEMVVVANEPSYRFGT